MYLCILQRKGLGGALEESWTLILQFFVNVDSFSFNYSHLNLFGSLHQGKLVFWHLLFIFTHFTFWYLCYFIYLFISLFVCLPVVFF